MLLSRITHEQAAAVSRFMRTWLESTELQRRIVKVHVDHPRWSMADIAEICKCSRKHVHLTVRKFTSQAAAA